MEKEEKERKEKEKEKEKEEKERGKEEELDLRVEPAANTSPCVLSSKVKFAWEWTQLVWRCGGDDENGVMGYEDNVVNDDNDVNRNYGDNDEMFMTILTNVNTAEVNAFPNPHLAIV